MDDDKYKGVRAYLHHTGILESGDEELINKVKKAYWRNYHKNYKSEKRARDKEYVIALNTEERRVIEREANRHNQSISQFLKQSAWAYAHKAYLIPDKSDLVRFEQFLSSCHTELMQIRNTNNLDDKFIKKLSDTLNSLETTLDKALSAPKNIEDMLKAVLTEQPHYIETLKEIINQYDNKVSGEKVENRNKTAA